MTLIRKLFLFVFLLIVLCSALFWIYRAPAVSYILQTSLGLEVEVGQVDFTNPYTVVIKEGAIGNTPNAKVEHLLVFDRLEISVSLFSLFTREMRFYSIQVDGLEAAVELYNHSGTDSNFSRAFPPPQDKESQKASDKKGRRLLVDDFYLHDTTLYVYYPHLLGEKIKEVSFEDMHIENIGSDRRWASKQLTAIVIEILLKKAGFVDILRSYSGETLDKVEGLIPIKEPRKKIHKFFDKLLKKNEE